MVSLSANGNDTSAALFRYDTIVAATTAEVRFTKFAHFLSEMKSGDRNQKDCPENCPNSQWQKCRKVL